MTFQNAAYLRSVKTDNAQRMREPMTNATPLRVRTVTLTVRERNRNIAISQAPAFALPSFSDLQSTKD